MGEHRYRTTDSLCTADSGGILITVGFTLLANELRLSGEKQYWLLGLLALGITLPLFIANMAYWGSFLVE
ncbi:hypothetical protein [Spirosoma flavum]|uniref:Cation/H+ exchanger domain-containing protein n=1 Tax=Spirosoma flavum TaxID=2048557 RepID=A0ABW6AQ94_9BACT